MIRGKYLGPVVLLVVFTIFMTSTMVGVNHGLKADSTRDAEIIRGEDYNLSDEPKSDERLNATVDPLPVVPDSMQPDFLGPYSAQDAGEINGVREFTNSVVHSSMTYASVVSVFTYNNQWWIKEWWVGPLLQIISYGGIAIIFGLLAIQYLSTLQEAVPR